MSEITTEYIEGLIKRVIEQNSEVLSGADKRLDRANEMVLRLTEAIKGNQETIEFLEKSYVKHLDQLSKCRDVVLNENVELRKECNELRKELSLLRTEMFSTIKELARRPAMSTVNNNQD